MLFSTKFARIPRTKRRNWVKEMGRCLRQIQRSRLPHGVNYYTCWRRTLDTSTNFRDDHNNNGKKNNDQPMEKQAHSHCCSVTILGLAMHMRNMRFMRIMRICANMQMRMKISSTLSKYKYLPKIGQPGSVFNSECPKYHYCSSHLVLSILRNEK